MWSRRSRFRRGPGRSVHLLRARNIHLIRCHDSAITNLTLLCRYQHTHFLQKGWTCRINPDRLPEWTPPNWVDPEQRPHTNTRIQRLNTQRQLHRRNRQRTPTAA